MAAETDILPVMMSRGKIFLNIWQWLSLIVLILALGVAAILITSPTGSTWGTYHEPHADKPPLRLSSTVHYEQTFTPEFAHVSGFLLFIQPPFSPTGTVVLQIRQGDITQEIRQSLATVPATGEIFVPVERFKRSSQKPISFTISLEETSQALGLLYQIDATKYPAGELTQIVAADGSRKNKPGDLAFRVQYHSSAQERMHVSPGLLIVGTLAILAAWYGLVRTSKKTLKIVEFSWQRQDSWGLLFIVVVTSIFFGYHFGLTTLAHPSGQGDEMKNLMYLNSTVEALKTGEPPHWHHTTCGGQPLMGNPEANTVGIGPLLGLIFGIGAGQKLVLLLEAILLATGMYTLARYFGALPIPALLPALLIPLSGYVVNRILIGHTMFTGGLAFAPWILLTYLFALQKRGWVIATSLLMALAFYRGDTHSLFYTLLLVALWGIVIAIQKRSLQPIVVGLMAAVLFSVFGAAKIMPVLEGTAHFNGDGLPPMVVLLTEHRLWNDVFLDRSIHTEYLNAEVTGAESEDWENIGLYTGLIPLIVAVLGLFIVPRHLKWLFGSALILFLILGEGTVYYQFLRHVPYLGSLLRMPSRTLILAIMVGSLLGALALQRIQRFKYGQLLVLITLAAAILDVGHYASQTLSRMEFATPEKVMAEKIPLILKPHPFEPGVHALSVARRNSVAPGSCQDFNVTPTFTINPGDPMITTPGGLGIPAQLTPNKITIAPPNTKEIIVRIAESSIMHITNGYSLPPTTDGLPIIVNDPSQEVTVSYSSPALKAGAVLTATALVSLILILVGISVYRPTNA